MKAILATYLKGDAALISAPAAISKGLLLNATASAHSALRGDRSIPVSPDRRVLSVIGDGDLYERVP